MAGQPPPSASGLLPAELGQRDVRPAGVAAEPRPLGLAVADEPELALRPAVAGSRPAAIGSVTRRGRSSGVGPLASAGSAAKNSRGRQPKTGASSVAGDLRDPRVVPVDLVVVELAPVGDHRLEALDLVLQVERRSLADLISG